MSSNGRGLTASPLRDDLAFNWVFLLELIVCGILTVFFLFYFNRLFATLVSYGLRAWTWHKYRVYIDFQALQISLLGGRVFFKGFKYHGNNETILIHRGYVTWCYWLRNVRELDVGRDAPARSERQSRSDNEDVARCRDEDRAEEGGTKNTVKLPCRLNASLYGAEWFVYNRSAAYDAVVNAMTPEDVVNVDTPPEKPNEQELLDGELRKRAGHCNAIDSDKPSKHASFNVQKDGSPLMRNSSASKPSPNELSTRHASSTSQTEGSDSSDQGQSNSSEGGAILRFLPIHIECIKAAVVLGNENTKSVLITKADRISGEVDAAKPKSSLDQYRQLFNFQFEHPVVQMKPNDDYKEDQTAVATRIRRGVDQPESHSQKVSVYSFWQRKSRDAWHALQNMIPRYFSSVQSPSSSTDDLPGNSTQNMPGRSGWQGLSRYLNEDEQDDKAKWSSVEYALVSTIVDSPKATMSFYWDVVGTVQETQTTANSRREKYVANVNGDIPPEWGINLSLNGATINYGPWADRQRADLQRVFFPGLCKNAVPSRGLAPGQYRLPTEFKLYIEIDDETILRVPIREESKNWKWAKQADKVAPKADQNKSRTKGRKRKADKRTSGTEVRPFGWIDIKVGSNAAVSYLMDMLAGPAGYSNKLELDLPNVEITTSVNHGLLWRSTNNRIACDLSNPLQWNGLREWIFDVTSNALELFILREHVFLFIDLVDDWASGPPPEYLTFTPFKYLVNLRLEDFRMYLNVNDSNIVNNPSDFDDNTFIIVFGSILNADICIPIDLYRPHRNIVSFKADAQHGGLNLHVPPWNTQATFLNSMEIATLKELSISGKYQYCSTTSSSNTDTLLLNLHGHAPSAQFYGFVIRYYLKIKDNYFGDDIRFKTLEEYQDTIRTRLDGSYANAIKQPHKKANDLDVILGVTAKECSVIVPANLYSAKDHIRIEIANIEADLRFTNYYMDLGVVLHTLAFSEGSDGDARSSPVSATSNTQLFIDGVCATGNRLFGLPPSEPTYICNWDFDIGAITGECTVDFLNKLANGVKGLAFSFDDDENALPIILEEVLHDVTFLRAQVKPVRIWVHVEESAFILSTGDIDLSFNDWAGSHYSKKLNLQLPNIQVGCVDADSASRNRSRTQQPVETHGLIQTTVSFVMIQRKLGFKEDRQLQQEHIKRHDQRTHRTDFLLDENILDDSMIIAVDPPAMSVPPVPLPCFSTVETHSAKASSISENSLSRGNKRLRRKISFLSVSSASSEDNASIVRSHSVGRPGNTLVANPRSRSLQADVHGLRMPHRDASASTGRQSSFYSALGEHRPPQPSSVMFSSSYMAPSFPLDGVEPDPRELPSGSVGFRDDLDSDEGRPSLDDIQPDRVNEDSTHVSFMIDLSSGVSGFFTPKAADAVARLLATFQAVDPVDILDELQIASMTDIFEFNQRRAMPGKVLDINLRTPGIWIRFLNKTSSGEPGSLRCDVYDQYDLSMCGLAVNTRSESVRTDSEALDDHRRISAFQTSLTSVALSAKERYSGGDNAQAAINGVLEDLACWAVSGEETSASIVFKDFEVTTGSSKLEYLASLIHRTEVTGSNIAEIFTSCINQQLNRVQLFTYLVATSGKQTPDPLFLTRPSYVLRSAESHLRTSDSWKIVARLHHMYTSLDSLVKHDIAIRCMDNAENAPQDAKQSVFVSLNQWRGWDLNKVNDSAIMKRVFGHQTDLDMENTETVTPIRFSFNTKLIRLVLDPGPKQNEISISGIIATGQSKVNGHSLSSASGDATSGDEAFTVQNNVIHVSCADTSINLNWELCELADDIMKLYQQSETKSTPIDKQPTSSGLSPSNLKNNTHIVITTEKGSISLDTINLRAVSTSEGLKASFVMTDEVGAKNGTTITLLLAADAATSRVSSHAQDLTLYHIRYPSIYVSYELQNLEERSLKIVKVAANCQELSFVVKQDILGLIEVLDLIIGDEVAQLYKLKTSVSTASSPVAETTNFSQETSSDQKVNVALFLDKYHIRIPLMQSLTYDIAGVVARASVSAHLGSEFVFDFDVKEHVHEIQTVGRNSNSSLSLLQMPSTNGRISTHLSREETVISIFASVEAVQLDAASVHSILNALNKPEVSNVFSEVQEDIKTVRAHIDDIFASEGKSLPPTTASQSKPLIYDFHITLAGFDVFANAQGAQKDREAARLDLNLGCIQLVVANRLEDHGPVLEYPELRVGMQQIMFELSRYNNGDMEPCGNLSFAAFLTATSKVNDAGAHIRSFHLKSDTLEINLFADTASSVVDIVGHLQDKIKDLDLTREKKYLRKLSKSRPRPVVHHEPKEDDDDKSNSTAIFASMYSLELLNIQVSWIVGSNEADYFSDLEPENLVLSLKRIDLSTRKEHSARLIIEDLQVQMVPGSHDKTQRSLNSALLPEVIFDVGYVSTLGARRLAFQAAGKSLDLRLTSHFIIPASKLSKSISSAIDKVRAASATWVTSASTTHPEASRRQPFFRTKRMESLLVDADFAGAVVYLSGKRNSDTLSGLGMRGGRVPQAGKYGQFSHSESTSSTALRAPGLAWKVEYKDNELDEPSLNAEVKVDASKNILYPAVVPLLMEIISTIKEIVSDDEKEQDAMQLKPQTQNFLSAEEDNILAADPSAVLGRTRLNLGLRICRQEFSLSCQPIARVAATAQFESIYITINTLRSTEHGHFFAASAAFSKLQASVQHVYSRESTGSFDVDSVFLSLMNSKHVSGTSGLSAILKISPMKVLVNAKQLQDFLLFREIWVPPEIRQNATSPTPNPSVSQSQTILVQRYQQVAATGAFPWTATISIAELDVQLDLGQAIGKSAFIISNFWISSKKDSGWEQNLCLGFDKVGVDCTGRMSGFVAWKNFKLRTSIQWPAREKALNQTPLIQGSLSFSQLRVKAAFDYQAFLVADITSFEFLMYNVRNSHLAKGDRLVALLDGEAVQVFCTTSTASQALALYQAFERLVQEKRSNYEASLSEIEKFMRRKSVSQPHPSPRPKDSNPMDQEKTKKSPISLHTDVIITLKAVNVGAFPITFADHQVFKLEALNALAKFAVVMDNGKIHSILGLTLGQLRIGLAGVKKIDLPKSVSEISVEDVVSSATGSRGGTILKVPKVEAIMQTWQVPSSNNIDYLFKSTFEGKVEVGWNYSRISYIRNMWASHSKALAQRLGKPLPISAVKITGVPDGENDSGEEAQRKITAEVNVPQSKYRYNALEPPIIETPQLKDMGEATPPLEWIGLHRDRLPNLTHQIVIVTLLEVASEVEDAYGKILGSS